MKLESYLLSAIVTIDIVIYSLGTCSSSCNFNLFLFFHCPFLPQQLQQYRRRSLVLTVAKICQSVWYVFIRAPGGTMLIVSWGVSQGRKQIVSLLNPRLAKALVIPIIMTPNLETRRESLRLGVRLSRTDYFKISGPLWGFQTLRRGRNMEAVRVVYYLNDRVNNVVIFQYKIFRNCVMSW